jgi:hypothetical protein
LELGNHLSIISLKTEENQEGSKEDIHVYLEKTPPARYKDEFINVG